MKTLLGSPLAALLVAVLAVLLGVSASRIYLRYRAVRQERLILEVRRRALETEVARLEAAVQAAGSPEVIERIAKETLNRKRPGESVVVVLPASAASNTPLGPAGAGGWFPSRWLAPLIDFFRR